METNLGKVQAKEILETENAVIAGVEKLAEISRSKMGAPCKAYSKNSLNKFCHFDEERKQTILKQIAIMDKIVAQTEGTEMETPTHDEWPLILQSLEYYGLRLKDDFQKILHKDDVIEVYSAEHIQLFRTFNFYNYSAYSYMDLLVNEWFHLWERSSALLQSLFAVGQSVISGEKQGITSMDSIPQHVYKEIYNSEDLANFESRSVLCKFGHICPLYKRDNSIGGFIINCRVKVLEYGEETNKLSFI